MYDITTFSINDKWFEESVPQNYVEGSAEGTPCPIPSMVIDETNNCLYVCVQPDATTKNTGWKKYVIDNT